MSERLEQDAAVAKARALLDRPLQDRFEGAVALEAFCGLSAAEALSLGTHVLSPVDRRESSPVASRRVGADVEPAELLPSSTKESEGISRRRVHSVLFGEFCYVLSVVTVGFWISSMGSRLGVTTVERAWRVALPMTLAVQWFLRRRFLAGDDALGRIRAEPVTAAVVIGGSVGISAIFGGPLGALLCAIWSCGFLVARRGWWLPQLAVLLAFVALHALTGWTYVILATCGVGVLVLSAVAIHTTPLSPRSVSPWPSGLAAGLLGGGFGMLLVVEPRFAWAAGVPLPVLTVVPSLLGSLWGGASMTRLWSVMPEALASRPLGPSAAGSAAWPVTRLFGTSMARVLACCGALSVVVMMWARAEDQEAIAGRLLVAHAFLAVAGLSISLLEAFGRPGRAFVAILLGLGVGAFAPQLAGEVSSAMRLVFSAVVCAFVAFVCVLGLLRQPARTIASGI